jgi:hypothetical protein
MSKDNAKGAARPSQLESTLTPSSDGTFAVYLSSLMGGGVFPASGEFTIAVWCKIFGRSDNQVRELFDRHDIPYRRYGGVRFYDAEDVRSMAPKIRRTEDAENPRHGGRRRKKAN